MPSRAPPDSINTGMRHVLLTEDLGVLRAGGHFRVSHWVHAPEGDLGRAATGAIDPAHKPRPIGVNVN